MIQNATKRKPFKQLISAYDTTLRTISENVIFN